MEGHYLSETLSRQGGASKSQLHQHPAKKAELGMQVMFTHVSTGGKALNILNLTT
jgi:hypothetical protein